MTTNTSSISDAQIQQYIDIVEQLVRGDYRQDIQGVTKASSLDRLGLALQELIDALRHQRTRDMRLAEITMRINAGLTLSEILENVYEDFREIVPYNRIGFALIEPDGESVCAQWAKSDRRKIMLRRGYCGSLSGSSLGYIIETGQPRILNDLREYLANKPDSESTRLIVDEGYQSSLTCPLVAEGRPVGFIFFSSEKPYTYQYSHVETLQQVAGQLSVIVEKGRLVSELAGQKRAIERQNEELHHLNELKSTFVGIAAHDLRSPLGVIEMAIGFLRTPGVRVNEDDYATLMSQMADNTRHVLNLIDDLLDVTKIESGTLEVNREPIDVAEFLNNTISQHAALAASKEIRVVADYLEAGTLQADPRRLRQVIDNLLSNAVKYSPHGSLVTVQALCDQANWTISVTDEGPGIKPEERDRLFQEFGRLSSLPTGGERSTGLGLAISRRMVEAHGGQIGVNSEPGQGSTFWISLPA